MTTSPKKTGVWLVGAHGGLATTLLVGARLLARGVAPSTGMVTAAEEFAALDLVEPAALVFGGHDIRGSSVLENARAIHEDNGTISAEAIALLEDDFARIDEDIKAGDTHHCGDTIQQLARGVSERGQSAREVIEALVADLEAFKQKHQLDRLVVVDVASTEPPIENEDRLDTIEGLEAVLDEDADEGVRASLLYAYAAVRAGAAFINFTPNTAGSSPAMVALAKQRGLPLMGNDGKTGETLVKSALAPMFRHRNLDVMSWQGYNMLGDRDGEVLADPSNKSSKLTSKDGVLGEILGYPLHTHVGIDYVPSLGDLKTAWDFIHFRGFLGFKMSMQFIWQGCDAVLAAPLVLDLIRLADHALRTGHAGSMPWLGAFFKSPIAVTEHDLHRQMDVLHAYAKEHS